MESVKLNGAQIEAVGRLVDLEYWYGHLIGKHGDVHQFDAEGKRVVKAISKVKGELGFYE